MPRKKTIFRLKAFFFSSNKLCTTKIVCRWIHFNFGVEKVPRKNWNEFFIVFCVMVKLKPRRKFPSDLREIENRKKGVKNPVSFFFLSFSLLLRSEIGKFIIRGRIVFFRFIFLHKFAFRMPLRFNAGSFINWKDRPQQFFLVVHPKNC